MGTETDTKRGRKGILKTALRWISIPFVIVIIAIIMPFFMDENGFEKSREQEEEIRRLKREIKMTTDSMEYYQGKLKSLNSDREELERVAREEYRMKRPTEDVYITDIK